MQRYFRWAIQSDWQYAGAGAYRRVAGHPAVMPGAGAHRSRQYRFQPDRKPAGQAELAAMRMPAQHHIEMFPRSLLVDFGRMRQQNRKRVLGNLRRGLPDIVGPVEMRVVDPGEIDGLIAPR